MFLFDVRNLTFDYIVRDENDEVESSVRALEDLNLTIEAGDFVAVLGRNGSGKSTLAKMLNAILLPSFGEVLVLGWNTKDDAHTLDIRRNVGMVFQNPDNQIVANVVEEDIAFGPENLGIPTEEIRTRVDGAGDMVGMKEFFLKSPNKLSGGQKQRVAIAGVLAMKPKCIVLDEPTSAMDIESTFLAEKLICDYRDETNCAVLLITHSVAEAERIADEIIFISSGILTERGEPEKLIHSPENEKTKQFIDFYSK